MERKYWLDEILEEILFGYQAVLRSHAVPGGILEEVKEVVVGDVLRAGGEYPRMIVLPDEATCTDEPTTLAETWELPVAIVAVVKDDEPTRGMALATKLAARARTAIIRERTLRARVMIQDTRSLSFAPSDRRFGDSRGMYAAGVVMRTTFVVHERKW